MRSSLKIFNLCFTLLLIGFVNAQQVFQVSTQDVCAGNAPVTFTHNGPVGGTWSVQRGIIDAATGTFSSSGSTTPGLNVATYAATSGKTASAPFIVFPTAPAFAPYELCKGDAFEWPVVTPYANFNVEYRVDGGPWSSNPAAPTAVGCYVVEARYVYNGINYADIKPEVIYEGSEYGYGYRRIAVRIKNIGSVPTQGTITLQVGGVPLSQQLTYLQINPSERGIITIDGNLYEYDNTLWNITNVSQSPNTYNDYTLTSKPGVIIPALSDLIVYMQVRMHDNNYGDDVNIHVFISNGGINEANTSNNGQYFALLANTGLPGNITPAQPGDGSAYIYTTPAATSTLEAVNSCAAGNGGQVCIKDCSLPVIFGDITARFINENLAINWVTKMESNNDHFLVQASKDGKNFTTIGTELSKARDGNSNEDLLYEWKIPVHSIWALSIAGLLVLSIGKKHRGRKWLLTLTFMGVVVLSIKCTKSKNDSFANTNDIYIRIAQVDKDNIVKHSKVVRVIKN
jgi:hypothetical protein